MMRRGGFRQRLARQMAQRPGTVPIEGSETVQRLLTLWSWGAMSAPQLQFIAEGNVRDGITHPGVVRLSQIGGGGTSSQNSQKDLVRNFFSDVDKILPPT